MSSLGFGGSPSGETIMTPSSCEQQVILDLQCQLRHLAKQNRDSVTRALSVPLAQGNPAVNAVVHSSQPVLSHLSHHLSHSAVTHSGNVGQTSYARNSHDEAEPSSFIAAHVTSAQPASVPKLNDVSYPNLTQSQSNPVRYSGLFPSAMQVPVSDSFNQVQSIQSSKPITTQRSNTVVETNSFIPNKLLQVSSTDLPEPHPTAIGDQLPQLSGLGNQANQSTPISKVDPYPLNHFRSNPISDTGVDTNFHQIPASNGHQQSQSTPRVDPCSSNVINERCNSHPPTQGSFKYSHTNRINQSAVLNGSSPLHPTGPTDQVDNPATITQATKSLTLNGFDSAKYSVMVPNLQNELISDGYQRALSAGEVNTMNTQLREDSGVTSVNTPMNTQLREDSGVPSVNTPMNTQLREDSGVPSVNTPMNTQLREESGVPSVNTPNRDFLEKQLEDTKAEVFHLDSKLKECNDICEQQKLHFRTAIVDLQTKLNNTIVGRNSVLELRRQEAESQERLINQLQMTFADVGAANQQQAQALEDASKRVANQEVQLQARNSTISEVHTLTILHATKRGITPRAYSNPMDSEHTGNELKEVLDCYEKEIEGMEKKIGKAERALSEAQEQFAERWKQSGEEQKQTLRRISEEHEEQLSAATERALNARKQTLSLQSQLALTEEQMQQQLELKTSHVVDVQSRLEELQNQAETTRSKLQTKCDSLASDLQAALNHHQVADEEKHQLVKKIHNLELELQAAKESSAKAEADVVSVQEQNSKLCNLEEETNIKMNDLKTQLDKKSSECEELSRLVEEAKEQSARHLDQEVLSMQEDHEQRMTSLTHDLTSQINDLTNKYDVLVAEYTQRDSEHRDLLLSREDLSGKLEEVQLEFQRVTEEKGNLALDLAAKQRELDVMQREKVQYLSLLEEKNVELSQVQIQKDQLHDQVNEREERCLRLREQTTSMAQLAEVASKASEEWEQEREHMKEQQQELTKELQELKGQQEGILKKLKIREKRLRSVEEDNKRLKEEIQGTARESQNVVKGKEGLEAELIQAKTKIDLLTIKQDKMKENIMEREQNHQEDISKYRSKIQTQHRDLTAAHNAIQATVVTDGKAVKVAESMQQQVTAKRSEIDTLHSDIHWLKECLDMTRKEKSTLVGERDQYKAQLTEMSRNLTNLTEEVQSLTRKRAEQRSVIAKLDESLKKAATEHGECKAVIERQEQDVARLKLKHQLDIKELQRAKAYTLPKDIPTKAKTKLNTPTEHETLVKTSAPNTIQTTSSRLEQSRKLTGTDKKPSGGVQPIGPSTRNSAGFKAETVTAAKVEKDQPASHRKGPTQTAFKQPNDTLRRLMTDEDLRLLLLEMQKVVSGQPTLAREPKKTAKSTAGNTARSTVSRNTRYAPDTVSHSRESGYNTKSVDKQNGGMTVPLLTSSPVLEYQTPIPDNLSLLSSVPDFNNPSGRVITPEPDFLLRPLSPVANLLSVSPQGASDFGWASNNTSYNNNSQSCPLRFTPFGSQGRSRTPDVLSLDSVSPSSSTTESSISLSSSSSRWEGIDMQAQREQLKCLQVKLKSLSKMGGHLQQENKDMAIMIKQQSSQLKKVRQQEHSFQQLVKKGK